MRKTTLRDLEEGMKDHSIQDDTRFLSLQTALTNFHDSLKTDLTEIKTEVKRTNGRVGKLENFKYMAIGALVIISAFVVPLLLNLLKK